MPIDDVNVRVPQKRACHVGERTGQQDVVRIEIGHDLGVGHLSESAVDSVGLAAVGLVAHQKAARFLHQPSLCDVSEELGAPIGGVIVLNHVGEVRIGLCDHAHDRIAEEIGVVVGRRHNRNPRCG